MHPRSFSAAVCSIVALASLFPPSQAAAGGSLVDPLVTLPWSVDGSTPGTYLGANVTPAGDVNGDGFGDLIVSTADEDTTRVRALLFLGSPQGLSTVPAWTWTTVQLAGSRVAPAGDVDRDGYSDIVVGLPFWDTAQHVRVGRIAVFHGGPGGLPVVPTYERVSPSPNAEQRFGYSVDTAGDVNGDGYDDVVVGAPQYADATFPRRGRVFVFHGGPSGLAAVPDDVLTGLAENGELGISVATAGDVNADGFADVIAGASVSNYLGVNRVGIAQIHLGSAGGVGTSPDKIQPGYGPDARAGTSVSTAGDLNGDGYADMLIGNPGYQGNSGRAMIVFGAALAADFETDYAPDAQFLPLEYFGRHVATLGDLDGDGYADFGVSADNVSGPGRLAVYRGGREQVRYVGEALPTESFHVQYGLSFCGVDGDGDGFAEIVVSDPFGGNEAGRPKGRLRMRALPRSTPVLSPNWPRAGAEPGSRYGSALAIVPYYHDDQFPRLLVGDPGFGGVGRVSVHLGVPGFGVDVDELPDNTYTGSANAQAFGARIVDAGDMDRDGYSDFAVSSPGLDNGFVSQAGRVDLLRGSGTYPKPPPVPVLSGGRAFDRVGSALAGRGDVNGDGHHDLLVGAREWDSATSNDVGKVWLVYGGPGGMGASPWTREGNAPNRGLGAGVALADLDGDGYTDVIVGSSTPPQLTPLEGRVEVHYGGPAGAAAAPGLVLLPPAPSTSFGSVVVALGDVTGDGIADLGVGAPLENGRGVARIYQGTRGRSQSQIPIRTYAGTQADGRLGEAMAGGGDVDGDGIGDFVLGEPGWDGGQIDEGRVILRYGALHVPEPAPGFVFESDLLGAELGASFAPLRDVDADGFADVIAGAPGVAGRVFPFAGGGGPGRRHELILMDLVIPVFFGRRFPPTLLDMDEGVFGQMLLRSPAGRSVVKTQLEARLHNEPFTGTGGEPSAGNDTGDPGFESFQPAGIELQQPGRAFHVRGRLIGRSPYFPYSRWITPEAHASGDHDVRFQGAVVGIPPSPVAASDRPRLVAVVPNPARAGSGSRIDFALPRPGRATIEVFDVRGARVRSLVDASLPAGPGSRTWDGRDARGRNVPAGLYFVVLTIEGRSDRSRLVRLP